MLEKRNPLLRSRLLRTGLLLLPFVCVLLPSVAFAYASTPPTQDDVLRAISKSVDEPTNSGGVLLAIFAVIGGLAIIFVLIGRREKREATPRSLVHHGKLLKEVLKAGLPLKPVEIRQLKLLAEYEPDGDDNDPALSNPLTLLLCPSVLVKRLKSPPPKLDRKVLSQVVKKLGARKNVTADQAQ